VDGINAELDKVNALSTQFTGNFTIQLKSPPSNDGSESVEEHPQRSKGNEHNIAFEGDLIAKHNKFKEAEVVICGQKTVAILRAPSTPASQYQL
jgi:hypothetical protein